MSIVIKGMEMPKYTMKAYFGIDADGNPLCMVYREDETEPDIYDVIFLPKEHGRLGDLDALMNNIGDVPYKGSVKRVLMSAPTIVPAEGDYIK